MFTAVKVRIYPDPTQVQSLAKAFGCVRWFWNNSLSLARKQYEATGKYFNRFENNNRLPVLKKQSETSWLKEPYSQCLQAVSTNLQTAFQNFYDRRAEEPVFKSKYGKQSITYPQKYKIGDGCIWFPKLGTIPAVLHRPIEGKVKSVTISKNCDGKYYASILVDDGSEKPESNTEGKAIGLDVGLTHFVTDSDGNKTENPRWYKKHERNLKIKQQRLSRRKKGSSNRNKARLKVAKVQGKIARCRTDFHHKLSRRIVDKNQVIAVENLNIKGMVKNRKLSKSISQVGWGGFCTMLKYKAERLGKIYIEVDRFYPSSKTCNICLNKIDSLGQEIREWVCPSCNTPLDRDINAAKNIRDEALRQITSGTGVKAYRLDVSLGTGNSNKLSIG